MTEWLLRRVTGKLGRGDGAFAPGIDVLVRVPGRRQAVKFYREPVPGDELEFHVWARVRDAADGEFSALATRVDVLPGGPVSLQQTVLITEDIGEEVRNALAEAGAAAGRRAQDALEIAIQELERNGDRRALVKVRDALIQEPAP